MQRPTPSSHDAREGGAWTPAQRMKNDVLFLLATASLTVASRLPRTVLLGLGRALGAVTYVLIPSARRIAMRNVARVFPDYDTAARRAFVRRIYLTLGAHLGDVVASFRTDRPPRLLTFAKGAREVLGAAIDEGRGVVLASAHLGPWESVAATLIADGRKLTVVAREAYDPRLTSIYDTLRGGRGVRTIYRGRPGAATGLLRTLRRGEVLGIPMDLASRVPSVMAPFLDHPARTPVGPARLALRRGAAVVVATAVPEGRAGYALGITRIRTEDLSRSSAGERELTARINEELGARIRAMPEAWVWMHPRWPDAPRRDAE